MQHSEEFRNRNHAVCDREEILTVDIGLRHVALRERQFPTGLTGDDLVVGVDVVPSFEEEGHKVGEIRLWEIIRAKSPFSTTGLTIEGQENLLPVLGDVVTNDLLAADKVRLPVVGSEFFVLTLHEEVGVSSSEFFVSHMWTVDVTSRGMCPVEVL